MVAKIKAIKANKSRALGVLPSYANLEMRLSKHNSGQSFEKLGLQSCKRFWRNKNSWQNIAAGYDGASILVESVHCQLISFTVSYEKAHIDIRSSQQQTY
jgi:hypothetical protein